MSPKQKSSVYKSRAFYMVYTVHYIVLWCIRKGSRILYNGFYFCMHFYSQKHKKAFVGGTVACVDANCSTFLSTDNFFALIYAWQNTKNVIYYCRNTRSFIVCAELPHSDICNPPHPQKKPLWRSAFTKAFLLLLVWRKASSNDKTSWLSRYTWHCTIRMNKG